MLRTIVERLSRGVVLKRRLPPALGGDKILVSPDASLRHWRLNMSRIDPQLFELMPRIIRKGDRVWDVGANVGIFTFAAAYLAGSEGEVTCFEPDAWLVILLRKSAQMMSPGRASVEVVPTALSEAIGLVKFNIARRGRAASHLAGVGRVQAGGERETVTVPAVTLDWVMKQRAAPNVLKIDVEGAENMVLRGAKELLASARPTIVCEVGRELMSEVGGILKTNGYEITDLDAQHGETPSADRAFWNILAMHPATKR
ncbi:MAG TPA: FkbM family methyltransferase [Phycisphaerales bacterium]|nr:FkbM family methyltransferase [Phycisphaerales bacterium]